MSQIITLNEMYEDSDDGSSIYSMEGYDVNYLGPPPKYEEFPPFKEKPLPPKPVPFPLQLNKKEYFAFHEAVPHGELYCEYPHCSEIFLPYVLWGSRHHCRSCGMTVCEKHCTRNITLSSSIMPYYNGDLAELSTPILATSKNLNTLPDIVTLKYACLLCSDKALSSATATMRRRSKSSVRSAEEPSSALVRLQRQPSDRVSAEINRLQSLLSEVRGELQARDQDVSQLAGQMDAYSQKTADLQKIIENLDMQLQVTRTEGRLSNAGRRKLKKLKKELMSLQSGHIDSAASSLSGSECGGDEDETSSAADSRGSSRSRAMSLEGVDCTENAHTSEHSRTLDPFYHNVVVKACGPLSSTGEVVGTSEPASPAGAAKSALSRSSSTAGKLGSGRKVQLQVETEERDKSSDRGQLTSSAGAARGDDTQRSPVQHPVRTLSARVEYSDIYEGVHGRDSLEDMLDFDPVVDTLALQSAPDPSSAGAMVDLPDTGNATADPPTSPSPMQGLGDFYALSTTSSVFCMLEDHDYSDDNEGASSSWVRRPTTAATSSYPSETLSARDDLTYSTLTSSTGAASSSSKKSPAEAAAAEATAETAGLLSAVLVAQSSNTPNPLRIKRKSHSSSVDSTA